MNLIKIKIITTGFFKLKNLAQNNTYIYTRQGEFLINNNKIVDRTKKYVLLDNLNNEIKSDDKIEKVQINKSLGQYKVLQL